MQSIEGWYAHSNGNEYLMRFILRPQPLAELYIWDLLFSFLNMLFVQQIVY
jgi:hypothetical protein